MKLSYLKKFLYIALALFSLLVIIISFFSINLPDYSQLKNYKPSIMTRVHNSSGELVKEYSNEYRVFIPIDASIDCKISLYNLPKIRIFIDI